MRSKRTKIKELPAPYDLKVEIKECRAEGYASEYGIAWTEGDRLEHRLQKQDKPISDIPASAFVRCILITKGAKWIISKRGDVLHRLNGDKPFATNPNAPEILPITFPAWLEERRVKLNSLIQSACKNDIFFADLWKEKSEEIKAGEIKEPMIADPIQSHLLVSFTLGSQSLNELELMMDYAEGKDAKLASQDCDTFFFRAIRLGYEAGLRLQQLEAELANIKAMKMASQTSAGKKQSQRTVWITARLDALEKTLGRKAEMNEIIEYIEDKTDPISGERIWLVTPEGDEKKFIQWGTNESTTVQSFKVEISRIRNKRKKFISR
jgi:hypothetical protein